MTTLIEDKSERIRVLEEALKLVTRGNDWQDIQRFTGLSTDKCIMICDLVNGEK